MSNLYGYAFHPPTAADTSLTDQADLLRLAATTRLPNERWVGCIEERSPSTVGPFITTHPAGHELAQVLTPGDHVFIDRVTRMSGQLEVIRRTLKWFKSHHINLHFLDLDEVARTASCPVAILYFITETASQARKRQGKVRRLAEIAVAHREGFFEAKNGRPPPFGTAVARATPPALDKHGKPRLMLVWRQDQLNFLNKIVDAYDLEKKTIAEIGLALEADWDQPETLIAPEFHDRAVLYYYELGRHYRSLAQCAARYINVALVPRWGSVRLKHWQPPKDLILTFEQQAERDRWQFPQGWAARPCATPEERAKHLKHKPGAEQDELSGTVNA